jgi:hypothetical protein
MEKLQGDWWESVDKIENVFPRIVGGTGWPGK